MKRIKRLNLALILGIVLLTFVVTGSKWRIGQVETVIRAATVLTTDYVATAVYQADDANQLQILAAFTLGSSSSCYIKIEFSQDKSTWYQENSVSAESGKLIHNLYIHELPVAGNYPISVPILTRYYRVSAKALTDATGTSLSLIAVKGEI